MTVPEIVQRELAQIPMRKHGRNPSLLRPSIIMHRFMSGITRQEAFALFAGAMPDGNFKRSEVLRAIDRGRAEAASRHGNLPMVRPLGGCRIKSVNVLYTKPEPTWPPRNVEQREAVTARYPEAMKSLREESPVKYDDGVRHTEGVLDILFPGNPWLCLGANVLNGEGEIIRVEMLTERRECFRGRRNSDGSPFLPRWELMVPNPMTSKWGHTQEGRRSQHTLENTGPRRFLIIEQDTGTPDEQAAVLLELRKYLPLVMVVSSGGKSAHGWFFVARIHEKELHRFMKYAVMLGADRALWTRSQYTRLPDGTRAGSGTRQRVLYMNPELIWRESE